MKRAYILLDVGGTEIKGGLFEEGQEEITSVCHFPAKAGGTKEEIWAHFASVLEAMAGKIQGAEIGAIGLAFPGPFDYELGVSQMRGLGKYDAIYGQPIAKELKRRCLFLENIPFLFLHDIEAFALGESHFGQAKEEEKLICLCLGTGAGSAFVENRQVQKGGKNQVPENGWIYNFPFKDSVIDDYLSVRGLEHIAKKITGKVQSGKELFEKCQAGEEMALEIFRLFGEDIRLAIDPFLESFSPNALVIGGQIGKSYCYFGRGIDVICQQRGIVVYQEEETSVLAMKGLVTGIRRMDHA